MAFFLLPGQLEKATNRFKFFLNKFILRYFRLMIPAFFVISIILFFESIRFIYEYENDYEVSNSGTIGLV